MQERKCSSCEGFEHIAHYCKSIESRQEKEPIQRSLNKFKVLKDKMMNIGEESRRTIKKDQKIILKNEKSVEVQKNRSRR